MFGIHIYIIYAYLFLLYYYTALFPLMKFSDNKIKNCDNILMTHKTQISKLIQIIVGWN